jgi:hypothetical protein
MLWGPLTVSVVAIFLHNHAARGTDYLTLAYKHDTDSEAINSALLPGTWVVLAVIIELQVQFALGEMSNAVIVELQVQFALGAMSMLHLLLCIKHLLAPDCYCQCSCCLSVLCQQAVPKAHLL